MTRCHQALLLQRFIINDNVEKFYRRTHIGWEVDGWLEEVDILSLRYIGEYDIVHKLVEVVVSEDQDVFPARVSWLWLDDSLHGETLHSQHTGSHSWGQTQVRYHTC